MLTGAKTMLTGAKIKVETAERHKQNVSRLASDAKARAAAARRRSEDARRKGEAAQRRGASAHQWQSETQRWGAQAQRSAQELRRWTDDVKHREIEAGSMTGAVRARLQELADRAATARYWEQRLSHLEQMSPPTDADPRSESTIAPEPPGESDELSITDRVPPALKQMLGGMDHGPHQAFRLTEDRGGEITMALDSAREDDRVIDCEGTPVLLVEPRLWERLVGTTLDANPGSDGYTIVVS